MQHRRVRRVTTLLVPLVLAACDAPPIVPRLRWYINPDNGAQAELAAKCSRASGGRYQVEIEVLPNDASQQREQLVRRLAARDRSIDLMSVDPPFVPELAAAGFLRPFSEPESAALSEDVLPGPIESARWNGRLVAAPFWANTQLLWFRRSVAARAGLELDDSVRWSSLIAAAERTGTSLEVQAGRYEGYMVWINALVASAGGQILIDPEAGKHVRPGIDSAAGRQAAAVIGELAASPAASPALSTADEELARASFQAERGGFMVNWPYVYGAAIEAVADGSLDRAVLDDIGWARYPRVLADQPSRPPLGGIHLAVSAYSQHPELAVEAIGCIASLESQRDYMVRAKLPAARRSAYDDPEVRAVFPMAELIRDSIEEAAPRPVSPYYPDVSAATVRSFHPADAVSPATTPAAAARLIVDVLNDRVLL